MSPFFRLALFVTSITLFFSCTTKTEQQEDAIQADSTASIPEDVGVTGDYDGDGKPENVLIRVLNNVNINPDEEISYSVEFSDPKFKAIEISPMYENGYQIFNEGNIDGNPGDELAIVVCDVNRNGRFSIYAFGSKGWNEIAESFNVPCNMPENINWEDVLVKTDSGVYAMQWETLSNDSVVHKRKAIILASLIADFDGDGEWENLYVKPTFDPEHDDKGYWGFSIEFSNSKLPPVAIESYDSPGCDIANVGNKDGKPGDEFSVTLSHPMYQLSIDTYAFDGKKWKIISAEAKLNEIGEQVMKNAKDDDQ